MATKRLATSTVDWSAFSKRVPQAQIPQFNAFKAKSDGYAAKVGSLPEAAPTVDWAQYQSRISIPGMVAEFKKQYEAMTVPYPKDNYTNLVVEQEKLTATEVAQYVKKAQENIGSLKTELARVEAMIPVDQMYMDEYYDAFPDKAFDTFDRPTMWPHTPEVQPEYLEQMQKDGKFDEDH